MKFIRKYIQVGVILLAGCSLNQNNSGEGILVSNEWLKHQLNSSTLVILHVGTQELFDSIHIQGSRYIDPYDFTVTKNDLRNELPEVSVISDLLRSVGVTQDSRILLYYEDEDMISRTARVFMTLDYADLGDRTFVLNGGLRGWTAEDGMVEERMTEGDDGLRPVTEEVTEGDIEIRDSLEVIMKVEDLKRLRWDPEHVIVDSRSLDEYYGELDSTGLISTDGHIEGAYSMDYKRMIFDTIPYKFRENAELLKEFRKAGMDPSTTAVYYCGSGTRASVNYLIARHLGYPALVYDGSLQEWEELELPVTSPAIDPLVNDK